MLIITSGQKSLTKGRIACRAVTDNWVIPYAAYTAADSHCFSVGWTIRKIAPYRAGSRPPCNIWFLAPTWVIPPNGILIGSAVFAVLANVTNRQTHRPLYSVCSSRPHLAIAAMRPNIIFISIPLWGHNFRGSVCMLSLNDLIWYKKSHSMLEVSTQISDVSLKTGAPPWLWFCWCYDPVCHLRHWCRRCWFDRRLFVYLYVCLLLPDN